MASTAKKPEHYAVMWQKGTVRCTDCGNLFTREAYRDHLPCNRPVNTQHLVVL